MALQGEAKKIYQREYMRKRRGSNIKGLTSNDGSNTQGVNTQRSNKDKPLDLIPDDTFIPFDADGRPMTETKFRSNRYAGQWRVRSEAVE